MNAVIYYSNTGQSKAIAAYLAARLDYPLVDIWEAGNTYHTLVLVFPVHCQRLPGAVRGFLKRVKAVQLVPIATYGRMCHGNVLQQLQKRYDFSISAAAYVPTKHSYLNEPPFSDYAALRPLLEKISQPQEISIPKSGRNILSGFFPGLRSRMGVRLIKNARCNGCGACEKQCRQQALRRGKWNRHCIRCLHCAAVCPAGAVDVRLTQPMRWYLAKKKQDDLVLYV